MRVHSTLHHAVRTVSRGGLIALVLAGLVAGTAFAGNPGGANKSSSSINLVVTASTAAAATSGPTFGDTITFAVSTSVTPQPFVHLKCFQDSELVLENWKGWFDGALNNRTFLLGPTPAWRGGAAECTAYLENWDSHYRNGRVTVLASTSFHVNG